MKAKLNQRGFTPIVVLILVLVVIVAGGVYVVNQEGTVPTIPSETLTPTTISDSTVYWKTNEGHGISFKYPGDLVKQPYQTYGGGKIPEQHFTDPKNNTTLLWFRIQENTNNYSKLEDLCQPCENVKTIVLDGQLAVDFGNTVLFFSPDKKSYYNLQLTMSDSSQSQKVFDQILSTFQFTN